MLTKIEIIRVAFEEKLLASKVKDAGGWREFWQIAQKGNHELTHQQDNCLTTCMGASGTFNCNRLSQVYEA
jgi:hypothetical protein